MAYVTLANYKTWVGITGSGDDTLLTDLITKAAAIIELLTNEVFEIAEASDQTFTRIKGAVEHSRFENKKLYFYGWLAAEAESITDDPTVLYLPEDGPPYFGCYLTDGAWAYPTVTINGKWGYSETPPEPIKWCTYKITKWLYDSKDPSMGDNVVITPDGQVLLPDSFPGDVMAVLSKYRRIVA